MRIDAYRGLTVEQIASFGDPIRARLMLPAHVYIWATLPLLLEATQVMAAWGATYKTQIAWCKVTREGRPKIGGGHYVRSAHEVCLIGVIGRNKRETMTARVRDVPSWFTAPLGRHSEKPEYLQDVAERMSPGAYLELFARRRRPGWTCVGDQLPAR